MNTKRKVWAGLSMCGALFSLAACGAAPSPADDQETATQALYGANIGTGIFEGDSLGSRASLVNNGYELIMQHDCNLVLYDWKDAQGCDTPTHSRVLWSSGTWNKGAPQDSCRADVQTDGNFVVYSGSRALWASGTNGRSGVHLDMQADGNVVLLQGSTPVWSTRTNVNPGGPPRTCQPATTGAVAATFWLDTSQTSSCGSTSFQVLNASGGALTSPTSLISGTRTADGQKPGLGRCRFDTTFFSIPAGDVNVCAFSGGRICRGGRVIGGSTIRVDINR